MNSLFIFPPHWSTSHPYLSIPCLASYLRKNEINLDVIDENLRTQEVMLSKRFLEKCINRVTYKSICFKSFDNYIVENIEESKNVFSKNDFYDPQKYRHSSRIIDWAYKIISSAYSPTFISPNELTIKCKDQLSLRGIIEYSSNREVNPFIEIFEEYYNKELLDKYEHVAISIVDYCQLYPALTLAKVIKSRKKEIHITFGGIILTKLSNSISSFEELFCTIDSICLYEGEKPLLELINALSSNYKLNEIPNIIYKDKQTNKIIINKVIKQNNDLCDLPTPDFSDYLNLRYMSPMRILPYFVTKKCYWGKCTFCDHDSAYDEYYRVKKEKQIIDDLIKYKNVYKADIIHFIDLAMPPKLVKKLCNLIIDNNLDIRWYGYIRADKAFDLELLGIMKKAGCLMIQIGAESFSQDILNSMNKGIEIDILRQLIINADKTGIWAHLFIIDNYPTENLKNKLETLEFIFRNNNYIHSLGISQFMLIKGTPIYSNFKDYNILSIETKENLDLTSEFMLKNDMSKNEANLLRNCVNYNPLMTFFGRVLLFRDHLPAFMYRYNFVEKNI